MTDALLTQDPITTFRKEGAVVIKGYYDREREVVPIQRAIYEIIGLVMKRHGLDIARPPFTPACFDAGYMALIAHNRAYGGEVYDLAKEIPAFLRLVCSTHSESVFAQLRNTDLIGIGGGSYGVRIDVPQEEKFRSHWHQEYMFQPQSIDGLVLWTPLVAVTPELGPVQYCKGSHLDGLQTYTRGQQAKSGAYQISIHQDQEVVAAYPILAPLTEPGDVILMDYLTIHQSGYNVADRARWSIQSRLFNFRHPSGLKTGWKASVTNGTDVESIFSDNYIKGSA